MTVHPHEIQQCLRLAGSYPAKSEARFVNDLKQVVDIYPTLTINVGTRRASDGTAQRLVYISGTVQISYRGATYNIPVRLWMNTYYPAGPPSVYVEPTPAMCINAKHSNVDACGQIHLPELKSWDPARSSIPYVIDRMIAVFSQKPPLYARVSASRVVPSEQERQALARQLAAQTQAYLRRVTEDGRKEFTELQAELSELQLGATALDDAESQVGGEIKEMSEAVEKVQDEQKKLQGTMEENRVDEGDLSLDDAIITDRLTWEAVDCAAQDCALQDCLDQLSDAVRINQVTLEDFLKETRRMATQMYWLRARRIKIRQVQASLRRDAAVP